MDDRSSPSRSPSLSPQTLSKGRNNLAGGTAAQSTAGATTTTATTAAAAAAETGRMDTPSQSRPTSASGVAAFDHRVALSRPRRSWDTAFLASAGSSNGGGGGDNTNDSAAGMFRPRPPGRTSHSATTAPAGAAGVAGSSGAGGWSSPGASTSGITITTAEREERGREDLADATPGGRAREGGSRGEDAAAPCDGFSGGAGGGASYFSRSTKPREPAAVVACSVAIPPTDVGSSPAPASPPTSSSSSSSPRAGGVAGSDDDLTDTDEGVMARLAEFTEMARSTAVHNEELSRELAAEKRRAAHTSRKLEQSNITCTELRESLALAQDTVMKLREHEMSWAETTASEMSLRAELCALRDEYSSVSGDASALRKRCEALQRENTELGERFATLAEEKRQVESRARRLLRSDRYRGY